MMGLENPLKAGVKFNDGIEVKDVNEIAA